MADTGYNWNAFAFMQKDAGNWQNDALADNATEYGDATSLDGKASCIVGVTAVEDNTGVIDGVVTVYVLGETSTGTYEATTQGSPYSFSFTPVQNSSVSVCFVVDPKFHDNFEIAIKNESGQELSISVTYKTATIPVAS